VQLYIYIYSINHSLRLPKVVLTSSGPRAVTQIKNFRIAMAAGNKIIN